MLISWSRINNCFKPQLLWPFFYLMAVAINLVLSGDRDILATNSPYDEYWYVNSAYRMVWGGAYNHMVFAQLQVYSLWLSFLNIFGIPLRLAIDVLWLISIGYLAFSLRWFTDKKWLGAFTFLLLSLHPYVFIIFDRALSETLLTALMAAVLAAGIEIWNCRKSDSGLRRSAALLVFIFGIALAYHTRKEGVVLLTPLMLLAVLSWHKRDLWWSQQGRRQLSIPLIVAPLAAIILLGFLLASANLVRWGIFARYELAAPGYTNAIAALNSIDTERTPRHITVTAKARLLAYEVSQTFNELRSFFEGEPGQSIAMSNFKHTGVQGEIGNGWFYWALRDAGARSGWHVNAKNADAKYQAIADELQKAFDDGRLVKRPFVFSSFLDPDMGKWINDVPRSFWKLLGMVIWPQAEYLHGASEDATPKQFEKYVAMLGRRNILSAPSVKGWLIAPPGTEVGFGTVEKALSWRPLPETQHPGVPGAYPIKISAMAGEGVTHLYARTTDGRQGVVALSNLHEGKVSRLAGMAEGNIGIDELTGNKKRQRFDPWLKPVCILYSWLGYILTFSIAASIVLALVIRKAPSAVILVIIIGATTILARSLLFGILDASSWSGLQARYMLPLESLFLCIGMLSLAFVFDCFRQRKLSVNIHPGK